MGGWVGGWVDEFSINHIPGSHLISSFLLAHPPTHKSPVAHSNRLDLLYLLTLPTYLLRIALLATLSASSLFVRIATRILITTGSTAAREGRKGSI